MIDANDLHRAAEIVGDMGADGTLMGEYGLPVEEIKAFIDESLWHDIDAAGPMRDLDPLALVMGLSIGVVAAARDHPQPLTSP